MPDIKGGRVGSMKALRQSLKKGSGGGTWIKRVPQNDSILVRFLTEPEDWFGYYEHYSQTARAYYPCVEDDCVGCAQDERRSFRYLSNAVNLDDDRVIPLKLPKDLANRLILKYDKYGTMMDRDYDLTSSGEGLDTTYDADAEAPMKRNLKKYELLDLGAILDEAWEHAHGGSSSDDDDEDVAKAAAKAKKAKKQAGSKKKKAAEPSFLADEEEEDDEAGWELDEDDEEEEVVALDEDEEDEEDDESDDVDWDDEDEDDEDDEESEEAEEAAADDEYEYVENWTEEELSAMSLGELKSLAKEWGIATTGKKKAALVEALLELNDEE